MYHITGNVHFSSHSFNVDKNVGNSNLFDLQQGRNLGFSTVPAWYQLFKSFYWYLSMNLMYSFNWKTFVTFWVLSLCWYQIHYQQKCVKSDFQIPWCIFLKFSASKKKNHLIFFTDLRMLLQQYTTHIFVKLYSCFNSELFA